MLVRMPDTVLATALATAVLIVVIVHLARELRDARRHIAAQAEALRLQAVEEELGPHLRTVGPPPQLSIVDGLRLSARRHRVSTAAIVLAALGVAAALLLPDGTPVENAAPDPDPPSTAPAPSTPERRESTPSTTTTPATTTSAMQAVTTTTTPARHQDHYSGTVAASSRPRRASSSATTASAAPAPASSQPCMLCDVVGLLLAA